MTITQIQTFHGQSCYNDQSGMDSRNDRQQCNIGNTCSESFINRSPSSVANCFGANMQDGAGDGFGPGAGFLKTRQSRPTHTTAMSWGQQAPSWWQLKNDAQQFYVALENGESHDQVESMTAQPEMVGWAAFQEHHGTLGEMTYEAGRTPLAVTDQPYDVRFNGFFRSAPKFYANIATYHGTNSAELRTQTVTPMAATIIIEEETCEGEQGGYTHPMQEEVGYVSMLAGFGSSADQPGGGIRARPVHNPGRMSIHGAGKHVAMAETGDVTLTSDWITVSLDNYFLRPVVIAGTPTYNGGDTVTVRIRNVRHGHGCNGWCFDIKLQEPSCLDGPHPNAESVNWMVLESGSWSMDGFNNDGQRPTGEAHMLQAGVVEVEGDMRTTGRLFHEVEL